MGNDATTKEKGMLTVLEVALEMYARGIKLLPVDIYKSDATEFIVVGEKHTSTNGSNTRSWRKCGYKHPK